MTPDPALFLSTIILASGTLVAIIGGLLVGRFVGLDTDQRSNRSVLAAADERLASARRRTEDARNTLLHHDSWDFFSKPEVLAAIGRGESDPAGLMRLAPCLLSEQELQPLITDVAEEFARARDVLADRISPTDYDWSKFRKSATDLPPSAWPMAWEEVFEEIIRKRSKNWNADREAARRAGYVTGIDPTPLLKLAQMPDLRGITTGYSLRRRDELAVAQVRAQQRVEDYEDELRRLRHEHAEIVRPDRRLWAGIAILAAFAGVGVAWPMYVMSTGPTDLASVRWFVWPFCIVLAGLIIYVVVYMLSLSRRQLPSVGGTAEGDRTTTGT